MKLENVTVGCHTFGGVGTPREPFSFRSNKRELTRSRVKLRLALLLRSAYELPEDRASFYDSEIRNIYKWSRVWGSNLQGITPAWSLHKRQLQQQIQKWRIRPYSSPLTLLRLTHSPMVVVSYLNLLHHHSMPFLYPPHTRDQTGSRNTLTSQHLHRPSRAQARRKT